MNKSLAVIPARGGSRRLPGKNIREFMGHPIIWYPIQEAKKVFDKVLVSTEDLEITRVAIECGAGVHPRPKELADDFSTTGEVTAYVARQFPEYDIVACIYPTAVFASAELMREGLARLKDNDVVFPIVEYGHPIQRALKIEGGLIQFDNPELATTRTQDLDPRYSDSGQFYIFKRAPLIEKKTLYLEKMAPLIIPEGQAQDVDNLEDWKMAEIKYELRGGKER